ncbi:MAG: TspO/MBR family protein [Canibacter sp.]
MNTRPSVGRQIVIGIVLLSAVTLIATLGSVATIPNTEGWYTTVEKVPWDPPNAVFGPVWSVLYFLIAVAGWLIWRAGFQESRRNAAKRVLTVYVIQLVLNGLWTPAFFAGYPLLGEPAWWIALAIILALIGSVIWLIVSAAQWSRISVWIMALYLLWLVFATSLNIGIIALN